MKYILMLLLLVSCGREKGETRYEAGKLLNEPVYCEVQSSGCGTGGISCVGLTTGRMVWCPLNRDNSCTVTDNQFRPIPPELPQESALTP